MKPLPGFKFFGLALAAISPALAGCMANAKPPAHLTAYQAHGAAADPHARTPKTQYAPALAGYDHHTPVEAADWRELNRRVAPPGSLPPATREGGQ